VNSDWIARDWLIAFALAAAVQVGTVVLFRLGEPGAVVVDLSDDNAKPVSVAITPIPDDLPLLKLGGKTGKLPDMWLKPKASKKKSEGEQQASTKADQEHAPTNGGDAGVANDASSLDPILGDAATDPNAASSGNPAGSDAGKEIDPAKAHAVDLYRAQLNAWFSGHFNIRGKVPFEKLKTLKATVVVTVTNDRKVSGYDVVGPSGDDAFDDQLYRDLAHVQASGAVLPAPPESYPDILGQTLRLSFSCKDKSACE
jgi:hypothetical protein